MRASLTVITDELRRLKASGVKTVSISEESLALLRKAVRSAQAGAPARVAPPVPVERVAAFAPAASAAPAPRVPAPKPAPAPKPKAPAFAAPPILPELKGSKPERWEALMALVQADPVCRAHVRPGKKIVLGVGNLDAQIMFVGEAPGAEEELQGEPFVGAAGALLNKMIAGMGLSRPEVYIGNLMNWRPEVPGTAGTEQIGNRPPSPEEMAYCLPYLKAQIEIVQPALLVALGASAAQGLLGFGAFKALGEVRGRWRDFCGRPLMITYHPSYILRNQSNRSKRMIWEDLLQVMEKAGLTVSEKQRGYFLDK